MLAWAEPGRDRLAELDVSDERSAELRAERDAAWRPRSPSWPGELSAAAARGRRRLRRGRDRRAGRPGHAARARRRRRAPRRRPATARRRRPASVGVGPDGVDEVELLLPPHPGAPALPLAAGRLRRRAVPGDARHRGRLRRRRPGAHARLRRGRRRRRRHGGGRGRPAAGPAGPRPPGAGGHPPAAGGGLRRPPPGRGQGRPTGRVTTQRRDRVLDDAGRVSGAGPDAGRPGGLASCGRRTPRSCSPRRVPSGRLRRPADSAGARRWLAGVSSRSAAASSRMD